MSTTQKYPIHRLPLPSRTLQSALPQLELDDKPSASRRSTTFKSSTPGVWARVNSLWSSWPLRITKEELLDMGVDVDKGEQVSVEDVLARWDPVDPVDPSDSSSNTNGSQGMELRSSKHRLKLEPILLGISPGALKDSLPHLDVGDAETWCSSEASGSKDESPARSELVDVLSGRKVLSGPGYGPWSTRYCGHQFGVWAGQLGDGRAISLLETESPEAGRQEIQLKGAGRTPFSRQADGLSVLRSGVREYLGCEAVAALGIPTTRSLALLTTKNLPVIREQGPEPPSLLARLAPSFIRIGHFEALNPGEAARNTRQIFFGGGWKSESETDQEGPLGGEGNLESLGKLTEWCMSLTKTPGGAKGWLEEVVRRNAEMVGMWQVYGFCHGVLNSDNISILGLTIDYGPYAFMDVFNESHICNHSDPSGLYSYKNQPSRVLFALDKLVSAVSPLIGYEAESGKAISEGWSNEASKEDVARWNAEAEEVLGAWKEAFWKVERETEHVGWMKRFGLRSTKSTDDREIVYTFLRLLHSSGMDMNASFRQLSHFTPSSAKDPSHLDKFASGMAEATISDKRNNAVPDATEALRNWLSKYAERASIPEEQDAWGINTESTSAESRRTAMLSVNPSFVLRQWVLEELISQLEGVDLDDEESIQEGRRKLAKILEMSSRPFEPWSELGTDDEKRLCGLGAKEMLGFQCSCSS